MNSCYLKLLKDKHGFFPKQTPILKKRKRKHNDKNHPGFQGISHSIRKTI